MPDSAAARLASSSRKRATRALAVRSAEELEGGAVGGAAGQQAGGGGDLAGIRPVEVREQRTARIGGDGGDRARAGPEAESMKRQSRTPGIEGHEL